jgi:cytochrome P450
MPIQTDARLDFDPYAPDFIEDPYPFYRRLRDEAPFFWSEKFNMRVLTRFADIQTAVRDWKTYTSTQGLDLDGTSDEFLGMDFLGNDPPHHGVMRNLVKVPFQPAAINALEADVRARAERLLDEVPLDQPFDLPRGFAHRLPISTIAGILGLPEEDLDILSAGIFSFLDRTPGELSISEQSMKDAQTVRDYLAEAARQRREKPRDDLLSKIALARVDDKPFSDEELAGLCFFLFNAGVDTTTSLITTTLYCLHEYPDQRDLVIRDPSLLPATLEESLRYDAPLTHFLRVTTHDVELYRETIQAGTRVMLVYAAGNRDDRRWEDPDRFDITREKKRHLAFGEGVHFCLGAPLARLEARIGLELILEKMPEYRITSPVEHIIKENQHGFRTLTIVR